MPLLLLLLLLTMTMMMTVTAHIIKGGNFFKLLKAQNKAHLTAKYIEPKQLLAWLSWFLAKQCLKYFVRIVIQIISRKWTLFCPREEMVIFCYEKCIKAKKNGRYRSSGKANINANMVLIQNYMWSSTWMYTMFQKHRTPETFYYNFAKIALISITRAQQEMRYPNVTWRIILSVYLFTTELRHACSSRIFF